jgi:hypothetical protein
MRVESYVLRLPLIASCEWLRSCVGHSVIPARFLGEHPSLTDRYFRMLLAGIYAAISDSIRDLRQSVVHESQSASILPRFGALPKSLSKDAGDDDLNMLFFVSSCPLCLCERRFLSSEQ